VKADQSRCIASTHSAPAACHPRYPRSQISTAPMEEAEARRKRLRSMMAAGTDSSVEEEEAEQEAGFLPAPFAHDAAPQAAPFSFYRYMEW
jgi:hypothetical protein